MPETARTYAELLALYPDNTTGMISPEDLRDLLKTQEQVIKALNATERGTMVFYGANNGRAMMIRHLGASGVGLTIVAENDSVGTAIEFARNPTVLGGVLARFNSFGAFNSNFPFTISGNSMESGVGELLSVSFGADVQLVAEFFGSSANTTDLIALIDESR